MSKKETKEDILVRMICERTKSEFDEFLRPSVQAAAQCWEMLDKINKELKKLKSLTTVEMGSQFQQKTVVHPLLAQYDKMHRTLMLHFEALGLNYKTTPSKITESTTKGVSEENDPMAKFFKATQ
ncbi:MAG: hypothetical protein IIW61_02720 [Bacteroidaceae bacterium]|nr:hypothetical protein [Bacteroidaceae bacterium]